MQKNQEHTCKYSLYQIKDRIVTQDAFQYGINTLKVHLQVKALGIPTMPFVFMSFLALGGMLVGAFFQALSLAYFLADLPPNQTLKNNEETMKHDVPETIDPVQRQASGMFSQTQQRISEWAVLIVSI